MSFIYSGVNPDAPTYHYRNKTFEWSDLPGTNFIVMDAVQDYLAGATFSSSLASVTNHSGTADTISERATGKGPTLEWDSTPDGVTLPYFRFNGTDMGLNTSINQGKDCHIYALIAPRFSKDDTNAQPLLSFEQDIAAGGSVKKGFTLLARGANTRGGGIRLLKENDAPTYDALAVNKEGTGRQLIKAGHTVSAQAMIQAQEETTTSDSQYGQTMESDRTLMIGYENGASQFGQWDIVCLVVTDGNVRADHEKAIYQVFDNYLAGNFTMPTVYYYDEGNYFSGGTTDKYFPFSQTEVTRASNQIDSGHADYSAKVKANWDTFKAEADDFVTSSTPLSVPSDFFSRPISTSRKFNKRIDRYKTASDLTGTASYDTEMKDELLAQNSWNFWTHATNTRDDFQTGFPLSVVAGLSTTTFTVSDADADKLLLYDRITVASLTSRYVKSKTDNLDGTWTIEVSASLGGTPSASDSIVIATDSQYQLLDASQFMIGWGKAYRHLRAKGLLSEAEMTACKATAKRNFYDWAVSDWNNRHNTLPWSFRGHPFGNLFNWTAEVLCGCAYYICALHNEEPEQCKTLLEIILYRFHLHARKFLNSDETGGGYAEPGPDYLGLSADAVCEMYHAFETTFGHTFGLKEAFPVDGMAEQARCIWYPISSIDEAEVQQNISGTWIIDYRQYWGDQSYAPGDANAQTPPHYHVIYAANAYDKAHLTTMQQHLCDQANLRRAESVSSGRSLTTKEDSYIPESITAGHIFLMQTAHMKDLDSYKRMPLVTNIPNIGYFSARSSWDDDAMMIAGRCSYTQESHQNREEGAFGIFDQGVHVISFWERNAHLSSSRESYNHPMFQVEESTGGDFANQGSFGVGYTGIIDQPDRPVLRFIRDYVYRHGSGSSSDPVALTTLFEDLVPNWDDTEIEITGTIVPNGTTVASYGPLLLSPWPVTLSSGDTVATFTDGTNSWTFTLTGGETWVADKWKITTEATTTDALDGWKVYQRIVGVASTISAKKSIPFTFARV